MPLGLVAVAFATGCALSPRSPGEAGPTLAVFFAVVVAVAATLGLLHLLLFFFEPRDRQNLWFVALAASFALVALLDYRERVGQNVVLPHLGEFQRYAVSAVVLAAARFAYSLLSARAPRRFWVYVAAIAAILAIGVAEPDAFDLPAGLLGLAVAIDALVTVLRGWQRLERGAWLVGLGAGLFAGGGILQLGFDLLGATALAARRRHDRSPAVPAPGVARHSWAGRVGAPWGSAA